MNDHWPADRIHLVPNVYSPAAPNVALRGDTLAWAPVPGAASYVLYRNGHPAATTTGITAQAHRAHGLAEYQVLARNAAGLESFVSEPVRVVADSEVRVVKPAQALEHEHGGFTGAGYLSLTRERNVTVEMPVSVPRADLYAIDVRYANGNGPINTDSRAALRTLRVDGREVGVLVMPQRGKDLWTDWGYSNPVQVWLAPGTHTLIIAYTPLDENMDRRENTALLDHLRLTPLAEDPALAP
jgi:hypothetical protein